ncbi:MAG TPA: hypothetical protein VF629_07855 [Hymenobacter sp.]|jgi:hypothetical protein|uniref:hypothetical protein n=1 Tax=Hymenobacter sp. TaxID=1898978 RepID=UPI002ED97D46
MTDKERHDFFKELYDKEFTRKEAIENSVNTPITVTTAVAVLVYFMASEYDNEATGWVLTSFFYVLLALATILALVGLWSLVKMYVNIYHQKYRAIPYADELEQYRQQLAAYHTTNASLLGQTTADDLFFDYLTQQYINQTASNTKINDTKLKELELTKRLLTVAIGCTVIAFVPFFYNFFVKPDKNYHVVLNQIAPQTPAHANCSTHAAAPTPAAAPDSGNIGGHSARHPLTPR